MAVIRGIPIILHEETEVGKDAFNRPIIESVPVVVENVLVSPISAADAVDTLNLSGRTVTYQLSIPKGDEHVWEDVEVEFFGHRWHTIGDVTQTIEAMTPLDWNKKIMVERHE